jgi:hypothetical protein
VVLVQRKHGIVRQSRKSGNYRLICRSFGAGPALPGFQRRVLRYAQPGHWLPSFTPTAFKPALRLRRSNLLLRLRRSNQLYACGVQTFFYACGVQTSFTPAAFKPALRLRRSNQLYACGVQTSFYACGVQTGTTNLNFHEIVLDAFRSPPAYFSVPDTCSRASTVTAPVRDRKATRFG